LSYPTISFGLIETGAPFFLAVAAGVGVGVSVDSGVGVSVGEGVGEGLCFFVAEGVADSSGVGVGEGFLRRVDLPEGVADDFAFAFPDGVGEADSFFVDLFLRCFRGVGVGVGWKTFLILSPSDSSLASVVRPKMETAAIVQNNRAAVAPVRILHCGQRTLQRLVSQDRYHGTALSLSR